MLELTLKRVACQPELEALYTRSIITSVLKRHREIDSVTLIEHLCGCLLVVKPG